jgi:hypothetical protein
MCFQTQKTDQKPTRMAFHWTFLVWDNFMNKTLRYVVKSHDHDFQSCTFGHSVTSPNKLMFNDMNLGNAALLGQQRAEYHAFPPKKKTGVFRRQKST